MSLRTECCSKCGIELYKQDDASNGRKIFRSFATKIVEGTELHFCLSCYGKLNEKIFTEDTNGDNS